MLWPLLPLDAYRDQVTDLERLEGLCNCKKKLSGTTALPAGASPSAESGQSNNKSLAKRGKCLARFKAANIQRSRSVQLDLLPPL